MEMKDELPRASMGGDGLGGSIKGVLLISFYLNYIQCFH